MAQPPPEAKPLPDSPTDGVTSLSFLSKDLLASSSWDGSVRIHDVNSMKLMTCQAMESGPLLSLATPRIEGDAGEVYTGGIDGSGKLLRIIFLLLFIFHTNIKGFPIFSFFIMYVCF